MSELPTKQEVKKEPLYKRWQTWLQILTPILLFVLGILFSPDSKEATQKADKFDTIWLEYQQTKKQLDRCQDTTTALLKTLFSQKEYNKILEKRLIICEGELDATTRLYLKNEANKNANRMTDEEKNDILSNELDLPKIGEKE